MGKHPEKDVSFEHRFKHKTLGYRWMSNTYTLIADEKGVPKMLIGNVRNIHKRKVTEMELERLKAKLESTVTDRTASLDEANSALRLMLKKENELKAEIEDRISYNVKELVFPYLERLKSLQTSGKGKNYLNILESNLNEILAPFIRELSSKLLNLSPGEIQVASLIKRGKTTKEIADLLNLSIRTIEFHRANIREKAGIKYKKTNLRSYIQSIA
jgi:DNA-binding CsgD family transcriptional regulator